MPVIFCVFFLFFPAGLVLYYLANALLSILVGTAFYVLLRNISLSGV